MFTARTGRYTKVTNPMRLLTKTSVCFLFPCCCCSGGRRRLLFLHASFLHLFEFLLNSETFCRRFLLGFFHFLCCFFLCCRLHLLCCRFLLLCCRLLLLCCRLLLLCCRLLCLLLCCRLLCLPLCLLFPPSQFPLLDSSPLATPLEAHWSQGCRFHRFRIRGQPRFAPSACLWGREKERFFLVSRRVGMGGGRGRKEGIEKCVQVSRKEKIVGDEE